MVYINININNHLSMSTNVVVNAAGKVICAVIYCNIGTRKEKMTTNPYNSTYKYKINYYCPVKNKKEENQPKVLDNQVHDFVFQKVSPLIKKS